MDGYELHGHLSEQLFSAIVDCFANFSSSVGSVSEEIYSLQAVYFSYTLAVSPLTKYRSTISTLSTMTMRPTGGSLMSGQTLSRPVVLPLLPPVQQPLPVS